MGEKKKKKEEEEEKKEEEPKTDGAGEGDKPQETDKITEAIKIREELGTSLDRYENLVKRQEKLAVENLLGGKSEAGEERKEEVKTETPEEYAKKIQKGEANPLKEDGLI